MWLNVGINLECQRSDQFMSHRTRTIVILAAAALARQAAFAANNDLVLGFNGGGAGNDYVINLGNDATAVGVGGNAVVNLSGDFNVTTFGSTFTSGNAAWGVGGGTSSLNPVAFLTALRLGGPGNPGLAGSGAPVTGQTAADGSATAGYFNAVLNNTGSFPALGSAGGSALVPVSALESWTAKVTANASGSLLGDKGINPTSAAHGTGVYYEDLYRGGKSGSSMNYTYQGYFTFDPANSLGGGTLTFTPAGLTVVPEPAPLAYGLVVGGGLFLYRSCRRGGRRQA